MLAISYCAISNRGRIREKNEDSFCVAGVNPPAVPSTEAEYVMQGTDKKKECKLFAVCDGLGGMNAGEVASGFVTGGVREQTEYISCMSATECARYLDGYLSEMNEKLYALSKTQAGLNGMGTTFVGLCVSGDEAAVLNVGDSRCYLMRNHMLHRLTTDHSEAERRLRLGLMTPEQAKGSKERSMLYRYIGTPPEAGKLECGMYPAIKLQTGDCFLLCSDGLTDMVEESIISETIDKVKTPQEAARKLIDYALSNGGKDNVTVVIVKVMDGFCSGARLELSRVFKATRKHNWIKFVFIVVAICLALLAVFLIKHVLLAPVEIPDITATPITSNSITSEPTPAEQIVIFDDKNLEIAIRELIGIPAGDIAIKDVSEITDLDLHERDISSINALKYFTSLKSLDISGNNISDIRALGDLNDLAQLDISHNNISDISAVGMLTKMTRFFGSYNRISGINSLTQLKNLTDLVLSYNYINDIKALAHLPEIVRLKLNNNNISDIEVLSELKNLRTLYLDGNPISNYSPVKDIYVQLTDKDFILKG